MLTKKICGGRRACCAVLLIAAAWFSGCAPPGPRALMNGEKLITEGRYAEAVESLQKATRLLPRTPQAWNHLGLAYQGNGQLEEAARAYRTALSLDHRLAEARYNLGCLLLEQNNLAPALDELTSYTLVHPQVVDGWLRLGSAYLKARRPDYAERCFKAALDLRARHPEALNGMGMVQFQRRRWQEAVNYFNAALAQDANFAPALLNAAITAQQGFNNRSQALQRYRQYLALQPTPAGAEAVESAVRQLEAELNPTLVAVPSRPAVTGVVAQLPARTNTPPRSASNPPAPLLSTSTRPPPVPATSAITRVAPPTPAAPTNPSMTTVAPVRPVAPSRPVVTNKPSEIEVTQVTAQDLGSSAKPVTNANRQPTSAEFGERNPVTNAPRKGFLTKLNPFSGRNRSDGAKPTTLPGNASANPASQPAADTAPVETSPAVPPPPPPVPRYTYLSPLKPTAGNRVEAELPFSRGLKAQQEGRRAEAIREYQAAMRTDPAYFDAYYNLGLAALDNGDSRLALWAYEIALSIKPDSSDARYNLGLALKAGGFHLDAVEQLEKAVQAAPADARPHLSLANIYAQQFRDNSAARRHYQKVLELNPRHPEAPKIRYWLAANP
jgi:tetratricopeptide (TPR) repeat protein